MIDTLAHLALAAICVALAALIVLGATTTD